MNVNVMQQQGQKSGVYNRVMSHYPVGYMRKGDRIFIRVIQNGRSMVEFTVYEADSYTTLMGEIREAGRNLDGLANVYIRNCSRGWSEQRPLKFYRGFPAPRHHRSRRQIGEVSQPASAGKRMLAPWETH